MAFITKASDIARALGDFRREGKGWRCRCPLHGGCSLVLRDGDAGRLLVTCWGGCDRGDVLAELRQLGMLEATNTESRFDLPRRPDLDEQKRIEFAHKIWDSAREATSGSPVESYLNARGIYSPVPASLRWQPQCWHHDAGSHLPAIVARVDHVEHGFVGVHRTYLTQDYRRLDRKSLGPIGGGAVRLRGVPSGQWLAVAEGIETALSITLACGLPAWAALSAGGVRALVLPPEATMVLICADHDANGVGQRAAQDAADRFLAEGRRVRIAIPPDTDTDFNDLLLERTSTRFEKEQHHAAA
jgi:putative DNA primase/helicase